MNDNYRHNALSGYQKRCALLAAIKAEPRTRLKLSLATGYSYSALRCHIDVLHHGKPKQIYVIGFELVKGKPVAIYAAGDKPDAVPDPVERRASPRLAEPEPDPVIAPQSWFSALGI